MDRLTISLISTVKGKEVISLQKGTMAEVGGRAWGKVLGLGMQDHHLLYFGISHGQRGTQEEDRFLMKKSFRVSCF